MRTSYDRQTDAGAIWLVDTGASDSGSVPGQDDLVFDYDAEDRIVGVEFLNASAHLPGLALRTELIGLQVQHVPDSDYVELRFARTPPARAKEVQPGVILVFDATDHLIAIEFKPASKIIAPAALKALT
jgi:uncharacterized protein YuzE